jgi:hypothetical protein
MIHRSPDLDERMTLQWVRVGIGAGLVTCLAYPLVSMAPLPRPILVVLASTLGPALALASLGLRQALRLHEESVAADLGALFDILAGVLLEAMVLVQLAVRLRAPGQAPHAPTVGVWLGLDVAWDVYVAVGTACFAIAMLRHPRFGKPMGIVGLVLASTMLALNLSSFPTPPAEAGLVDIGPGIGLWYLVATILMWRSMSWLKGRARERRSAATPETGA